MKKDRNCGGTPYPIYNNYQQVPNMMPPMPGMMPMPMYTQPIGMQQNQTISNFDSIEAQLNMLDKRVTKLENMVNSTSTYNNFNDSNYHIM